MGNSPHPTIPHDYQLNSHPALASSVYDSSQNQLYLSLYSNYPLSNWKHNLYFIKVYNKHLFFPIAFRQPSFQIPKCCAMSTSDPCSLKVCYQPFIYTLRNQIIARKFNNRNFKQHEIWKIIKCGVLSLRDWECVYQNIPIGKMIPQNFVIDSHGYIKFVNQFSFPNQDQFQMLPSYIPPENRSNSIIKYGLRTKSGSHPITSATIYTLGITILEMVSLEQAEFSEMPVKQKKFILDQSLLFNKNLKQLILMMTEDDPNLRPSLYDMQVAIKRYKQVCKQKIQY